MDAEIAAAKGRLDFWMYGFYPPASVVDVDESQIMAAYDAHVTSAHKLDVKFCFRVAFTQMMQPGGSGDNFQALCDYIADQIQDPAYFRMKDGKPLIALYNDTAVGGGWIANSAKWTQLKDTIGEAVFAVAFTSASMVTTLGLQGLVLYEYNGTTVTSVGRHPYSDVVASDTSKDSQVHGGNRCSSRTTILDRRAFMSEASTAWSDGPTQPEWLATLQNAIAASQKLVLIATWDEQAEAPGLVPTVQDGSRLLDAINWIRSEDYPLSYAFNWSFNWKSCGTSGTWTEYFPDPNGVQGAHDGDQVISSETNAFKTITLNLFSSVDVYAETGPDCGILEILKDDVLDQTIDCYAASQTVSALVATVTFSGTLNTHTLKVRVKGTKNASSSSVQIKLDYARPTYRP